VSQIIALSCQNCSQTPLYLIDFAASDATSLPSRQAHKASSRPPSGNSRSAVEGCGVSPSFRVYAVQLSTCFNLSAKGVHTATLEPNEKPTADFMIPATVFPFNGSASAAEPSRARWKLRALLHVISEVEDGITRQAATGSESTQSLKPARAPRKRAVAASFATPPPAGVSVRAKTTRQPPSASSNPSAASSDRPGTIMSSASSPFSVGSSVSSRQNVLFQPYSPEDTTLQVPFGPAAGLIPAKQYRNRQSWASKYRTSVEGSSDESSVPPVKMQLVSNSTRLPDARLPAAVSIQTENRESSRADYYGYIPGTLSGPAVASSPPRPRPFADRARFLAAGSIRYPSTNDELSGGNGPVPRAVLGATERKEEAEEARLGSGGITIISEISPPAGIFSIPVGVHTFPASTSVASLGAPARRIKPTDHHAGVMCEDASQTRFHFDGEAGGTGAGPNQHSTAIASAHAYTHVPGPAHMLTASQKAYAQERVRQSFAGNFRLAEGESLSFSGVAAARDPLAESPSSSATTISIPARMAAGHEACTAIHRVSALHDYSDDPSSHS
jgi:hypothetical protein